MALVFQYGSNMSSERLNSVDRLNGDAQPVGIAYTEEIYELVFDIWSKTNKCAAANLLAGAGRLIWGVLYEVPDWLIRRETAKGRRSLDAIQGEGTNYQWEHISLRYSDGTRVPGPVITYIGKYHRQGIETSLDYATHILKGLHEHNVAAEYVEYVKARIIANNLSLTEEVNRL